MKYIVVAFVLLLVFYLLSFARHNRQNGNNLGAVGAALMGFAALALSVIVLFIGNYEI